MIKSNNQIARLHTSCKDCIFIRYGACGSPIEEKSQSGCEMKLVGPHIDTEGQLSIRHVNSDIEVLEAYDDEEEFFVLNNTKCHYKRNES